LRDADEKGNSVKKKIIIRCLLVVGVIALIWIGSIIKCEILTYSHGDEFTNGYKTTNMIDSVDGLKVLVYSSSDAKVLYYTYDKEAGGIGLANLDYISFTKEDGKWEFSNWYNSQRWDGDTQWPYIFLTFGGQALMFFFGIPVIILLFMLRGTIKKEKALKTTVETK
jgi:hypothetical protein